MAHRIFRVAGHLSSKTPDMSSFQIKNYWRSGQKKLHSEYYAKHMRKFSDPAIKWQFQSKKASACH